LVKEKNDSARRDELSRAPETLKKGKLGRQLPENPRGGGGGGFGYIPGSEERRPGKLGRKELDLLGDEKSKNGGAPHRGPGAKTGP